jgi:catechol 2,3-dioxygenase-like lactoylglutathione lyase family enzyme
MIYLDGISHYALRTADVERSVQFYLNAVGIDLTERNEDGTAYLRRGPKHHCLALYPLKYEMPDDPEMTGRLGLDHVGFAVSDRSAVDEAARTLEQAGARILVGPGVLNEPGSPYAVRFSDPDGNRIEICAEMEDWAEPDVAQAAKPLRLGHVNFHVRDLKESLRFYTEVLGFEALDWIADFFVFLKCPGDLDHHNTALVKSPEVAPSMNHAAFEVRDFEALKNVADMMWKNGVRILWGPSRHGPGHNLFIYFQDPDGNVIEIFTEIDKIPDVARYRRRVWSIPEAACVWSNYPAPRDFVEATEAVGLIANQGAADKTKT